MFRIRTGALSLAFLLAGVSFACAASAGSGGAGGAHYDWLNLFWRVLTVAMVVGVIWRFAGRQALAFFRGRRSGIEKELNDLEARKQEARENLAAVEKRIANLEAERQAILADYKARGEALAGEIVAKAEDRAKTIGAQARQAAQNEIDQAVAAMRGELAEAVAASAREVLAASLTPAQHEKIIDSFLDKVVIQ